VAPLWDYTEHFTLMVYKRQFFLKLRKSFKNSLFSQKNNFIKFRRNLTSPDNFHLETFKHLQYIAPLVISGHPTMSQHVTPCHIFESACHVTSRNITGCHDMLRHVT
jgi:hypothetical protein